MMVSPQVWLVDHPTSLDQALYQNALTLLDASSVERIRRFYHRADGCRCLIGRILPRVLLSEQRGVSAEKIHIATTEAGKPYFVANIGPRSIGFNVSHDNELVAMAFAPGEHAFLIGVDVMRVRVPTRGTEGTASFLRAVGETTMPRSVLSRVMCQRMRHFPAFISSGRSRKRTSRRSDWVSVSTQVVSNTTCGRIPSR